MTTQKEYAEFVASKCKDGEEILKSLSGNKAHILHMLIGLAGEYFEWQLASSYEEDTEELGDMLFYLTGLANGYGIELEESDACDESLEFFEELEAIITIVKRDVMYNKAIAVGALQLHLQNVMSMIHEATWCEVFTLERLKQLNMDKLNKRYKAGYTDQEAQARNDKEGEE